MSPLPTSPPGSPTSARRIRLTICGSRPSVRLPSLSRWTPSFGPRNVRVYISCGLDVPKHRLRYLGFQVFDDHDHFRQLGFAVFELCLLRGDHVDEDKWIHDRKGHDSNTFPP